MELSDNQVELEITALEKMNDLALAEKPSVQVAKIDSPIERVEEKLSDFVSNMFIATREDIEFNKKINREIITARTALNHQIFLFFSKLPVEQIHTFAKFCIHIGCMLHFHIIHLNVSFTKLSK